MASGREEELLDGERPVHDAITYLKNNAERMDYAGAIKRVCPSAAATSRRFGLRMKRCGSRRHRGTGNLRHLRALAISDRWDAAMDKLFATQRTSVRRRAA